MRSRPVRFLFIVLFLSCLTGSKAQNWDINLLKSINPSMPNSSVWRGFTSSVSPVMVGLPVGMYLIGQLQHNTDRKHDALHIAGSILTSIVLTQGAKYIADRERPYITYPLDVHAFDNSEPGLSFPSQHASLAFATATVLSLRYHKWYVTVPAFAWASMVGYSRLYLGEHYPSDVIAGAALGTGSALLSEWLTRKLWPVKKR